MEKIEVTSVIPSWGLVTVEPSSAPTAGPKQVLNDVTDKTSTSASLVAGVVDAATSTPVGGVASSSEQADDPTPQVRESHRVGESAPAVRVAETPTALTEGSGAQADGQTPQFGESAPAVRVTEPPTALTEGSVTQADGQTPQVGESAPAVRVTEPPTTLTRGSVAQADGQTPQVGEPSPIPTPPAGSAPTSSSTSYTPVGPPSGPFFDTSLEEKIADHAIVVRATMSSFSSEVVVDADNKYRTVLKFSLT